MKNEYKYSFEDFKNIISTINGILPGDQKEILFKYSCLSDGVRVEIGCLAGLSTCCIALGMKSGDLLLSIDPFLIEGLDSEWPNKVICEVAGVNKYDGDSFFDVWKKQVTSIDFSDIIISPVVGKSFDVVDEVFVLLNGRSIGLLFIDGLHSYSVVKKELELYLPMVSKNGYVLFHDYVGDICDAVKELIECGQLKMIQETYLCVTQKL